MKVDSFGHVGNGDNMIPGPARAYVGYFLHSLVLSDCKESCNQSNSLFFILKTGKGGRKGRRPEDKNVSTTCFVFLLSLYTSSHTTLPSLLLVCKSNVAHDVEVFVV